jgi:hypothetical protein
MLLRKSGRKGGMMLRIDSRSASPRAAGLTKQDVNAK